MIHILRNFAIAVALAAGISACAAVPDSGAGSLDSRLAWPCERLVLSWSMDVARLQQLLGETAFVRNKRGVGQLQLSVMACEPQTARRGQSPLLFAYLAVPVMADSVPLVVTSIPADGWSSLLRLVADSESQTLFSDLGYDVLAGGMSFVVNASDSGTTAELKLTFDNGHIAVTAKAEGTPLAHEATRALLSSGSGYLSAFFGEENGKRYPSVSATVQIEGDTPLSKLDLASRPETVELDIGLRSERIFWRMPTEKVSDLFP